MQRNINQGQCSRDSASLNKPVSVGVRAAAFSFGLATTLAALGVGASMAGKAYGQVRRAANDGNRGTMHSRSSALSLIEPFLSLRVGPTYLTGV